MTVGGDNRTIVLNPTRKMLLSVGLLSLWLVLLMLGHTFGGAVYLLLIAALALFPWRALRSSPDQRSRRP